MALNHLQSLLGDVSHNLHKYFGAHQPLNEEHCTLMHLVLVTIPFCSDLEHRDLLALSNNDLTALFKRCVEGSNLPEHIISRIVAQLEPAQACIPPRLHAV